MKKLIIRSLSLLLCIALCISLMPSAFAAMKQAKVTGSFHYNDARSMLSLINEFRTGSDAWYWNEDNETKTEFNKSGKTYLGTLSYDYGLEKIAMERARELVLLFDHQRPNGQMCFTLTADGVQTWGENIAYGTDWWVTRDKAFELWREDDELYYGQGHRRNMLSERWTAVGVGCFHCGEYTYWVQEFSTSLSSVAASPVNENEVTGYVEYDDTNPEVHLDDCDSSLPTITSQPSSVTKAAGETATFKVTATDATSYQWQYYSSAYGAWYDLTNSAYSGAKTNSMSVQATTARNGYLFRCAVTNAAGTVYTNSVKLTVASAPVITAQPSSVTKAAGETATFKVTATGASSYQWQYYSETYKAWYNLTNSAYSGAKTNTMSVQATTARNGYLFRCAITNAAGTVYTNSVKLTVASAPVITAQPSSVTKAAGQTATFKVTATGASSYQWQYYSETYKAWYNLTNSAYSGVKTNSMSVQATTARNGYIFRCAITNAAGTVYTNSVKLTVASAPVITAQPSNVTKAAGQTATFTVTASGATSYQWQYYSETYKAWYNLTNSAYSGAKTNSMSVQATAARNGFIFRCAITNANGTVYTNSVKLTVTG